MAFLTIAAVDYDVQTQGAGRAQNIDIGNRGSRAFAGNLRVTVRAEKRVWEFVLAPLTQAVMGTLRANTALGQFVACSGTLLGGAVSCQVTISNEEQMFDASDLTSFKSVARIRLEEV